MSMLGIIIVTGLIVLYIVSLWTIPRLTIEENTANNEFFQVRMERGVSWKIKRSVLRNRKVELTVRCPMTRLDKVYRFP